MRYWITVASKDHVMRALNGNFMQAGHGKLAPLKRLAKGDQVIFYSPKITLGGNETCQCFTALGEVADDEIFQFKMTEDFVPYRRRMKYQTSRDASIIPLIEQLEFIVNKKSWGFRFRFGLFEIGEQDFNLIKSKILKYEKR
jgi:hypothetical protein